VTDYERRIFTEYENNFCEKTTESGEDKAEKESIRGDIEYENMMAYYESLMD
jgi:hypothetical protein